MKFSPDMICTIDATGKFIQVSASCWQILGYEPEELEGKFAREFIHPKDHANTLPLVPARGQEEKEITFENCYFKKTGEEVLLLWSVVWSEADNFFFCIARDVTEQKADKKKISRKEELHRVLVTHGSDMVALLDEAGNYLYVAGGAVKQVGYEPEQLIGLNALDLIHPEDLAPALEVINQIHQIKKPIHIADFRFKTADGQWLWVESTVSNQLENPALQAIIIFYRNSTLRKEAQLALIQSEQRFRSLFQNNPDMVLYQNGEGIILDVNSSFLSFLNISREAVLGRRLADFLPREVIPLFDLKLHESFAGDKVVFKAEINFDELGPKVLNVVKVPLRMDNKVVAVHAVLKDITPETQAYRTIEQQAKKLNTIFESITDAFYTLNKDWKVTYMNQEAERLLHRDRSNVIGKNIWASFAEEVTQKLYPLYKQAADTGEAVQFEVYLETHQKWFDIRVFPAKEELSVYFRDITNRVVTQKELEKLSLVANKTSNSVIITDAQGLTEWVNEGFINLTGYTLAEIVGKKPGAVLQGPETDPASVKRISDHLKAGEHFTEEILNYRKSGEKFWLFKEVTPVRNEAGKVTRFIAIQNDITARKRAEAELRKLSLVASKTSNGAIITDAAGRTEWINDGFTRNTGYTLAELIGKKPGELLHGPDTDPAEVDRIRQKLKEQVPFNSMLINYKKSGEPLWISMDISPVFDEAGHLVQYIALQKDITYRKEAEAKLVTMSQDLYDRNRDLQQFTYIISHNLRSPVANAVGLSKMLLQLNKESADFELTLGYLNESVVRLDAVLKDINLILSIRDKKNVLEKESISVSDVCQQVLVDLIEPVMQSNGQVNVDIQKSLLVQANRAYLYSIFYNLLSNAIKYRSENRTLLVTIKAVKMPDGRKMITFTDNGSGFDMKKVGDNIFKLYKRFHASKEGRGIGLFLVKTHVEALDGQIEVTSQVDEGTSFTIYLD